MEYNEFIETYKNLLYSKYNANYTSGVELEFGSKLSGSEINTQLKELELSNPISGDGRQYSSHGNNISYSDWNITYDASVRVSHYDKLNAELISPVLYNTTMKDLDKVMDYLSNNESFKVNKSCGTHIHLANSFTKNEIKSFILMYIKNIDLIDKLFPRHRRNTQYVKKPTLRTYTNFSGIIFDHDRYHHINLNNYERTGTIEFRLHEGTFDFIQLFTIIIFLQHMIDAASNFHNVEFESIEQMCHSIKLNSMITSFLQTRIMKHNNNWYDIIKDDNIIHNI